MCHCSSAAGTHVKYECDCHCHCDSGNQTCPFARSTILLTEKLTNGALVTPTHGPAGGINAALETKKAPGSVVILHICHCSGLGHEMGLKVQLPKFHLNSVQICHLLILHAHQWMQTEVSFLADNHRCVCGLSHSQIAWWLFTWLRPTHCL